MAKVRGPLLSFSAGGQIAKTQVYSRWKGRPYSRQYVIPSNPQTDDQSLTRDVFSFLNGVYKTAPPRMTEAWDAGASGRVLTGRNLFIKDNLPLLRGTLSVPVTDNDDMVWSPGARAGFPAASATPTPGNDQVSIAIVAPTLPDGWTIVEAVAAVMVEEDPHSGTNYAVYSGFDATSTYAVVITGLPDSTDMVGGAWFKYLRPDGKNAYGRSLPVAFTTT